ncbi:hypothetical protein PR048_029295 [Dryococelus australis]|uniref:Histone deacetylase domain-containing protein n=1 Tax=Dryococelus australis TaxID=614101 RepID=A0ABQ9GCY4_9NEOP|nr:hypothetical protein PR048_029295 [Dryococelus australis]
MKISYNGELRNALVMEAEASRVTKRSSTSAKFAKCENPDLCGGYLQSFLIEGSSPQQLENVCRLPIVHHNGYVCDLPPNHRFPMAKFHNVLEHLIKDGVIAPDKQVVCPQQVPSEIACTVHSAKYVEDFFCGKTSAEEQRATGFTWTSGLASRVRYETGGTVLAAQLSLQRGMACSTAGGTHHAYPDHGSGFCLINDLAVAAQYTINTTSVSKVLVVDLDVHQGDGTAHIFKNQDCVFTFSMHCIQNFPLRKQHSDLDVGLDKGTGDVRFISTLHDYLPFVLDSFRPDLVLYDAGVDPHKDDELGKLQLTDKGLFERDFYVMNEVVRRGIPCASVIGGGYSRDINMLANRHTIVHRAATKVWTNRKL